MDGIYQSDKMIRRKIADWISESISQIHATGNAVDVHVDKFIDVSDLSEVDLIKSSIELFNLFIKPFSGSEHDTLSIYLNIELKEFGDRIKGAPNSFEGLCNEFDQFSMPEIILYKPAPLMYPSKVEIYRKPLFFEQLAQYPDISVFYKEDRFIEDGNEGSEFRREVNVIYTPS